MMTALAVAGWLGTLWVLGAYGYTSRTGNARPFHWANAIGCMFCGAANAALGAWPAVAMNMAFGALGVTALVRR